MLPSMPAILVLAGLIVLVSSLARLYRLLALLPIGPVRSKWFAMTVLVGFFVAGYLGYVIMLWDTFADRHEMLVSFILLPGAIFVWLAVTLSLQTVIDLRRIVLLESENITDPLTKAYNRRYLDRRLEKEVVRARRNAFNLSILMLDIDHFKLVNDRHGHQAGDVVLSTLCKLVRSNLREQDCLARYGGEEFVVICTNTNFDVATEVAERLRNSVEMHPVQLTDSEQGDAIIPITISIGVAELNEQFDTPEKLMQAVDNALYRAKANGRNRVEVAQ